MPLLVRYHEGLVGVWDDYDPDAESRLGMLRDIYDERQDCFELDRPYWECSTPSQAAYARYRILHRRVHRSLGGTSSWRREWRLMDLGEFLHAKAAYAALARNLDGAEKWRTDPSDVLALWDLSERLLLPYFDDSTGEARCALHWELES